MAAIELRGIVGKISGNACARFISKLMRVGATFSADPIAVGTGAAVPGQLGRGFAVQWW
jgi:hypothetical protein